MTQINKKPQVQSSQSSGFSITGALWKGYRVMIDFLTRVGTTVRNAIWRRSVPSRNIQEFSASQSEGKPMVKEGLALQQEPNANEELIQDVKSTMQRLLGQQGFDEQKFAEMVEYGLITPELLDSLLGEDGVVVCFSLDEALQEAKKHERIEAYAVKIESYLESKDLRRVKVPDDGNCFYFAVAEQVGKSMEEVRLDVHNFVGDLLRDHPSEEDPVYMILEAYDLSRGKLQSMHQNGCIEKLASQSPGKEGWADAGFSVLVAACYKRPVMTIVPQQTAEDGSLVPWEIQPETYKSFDAPAVKGEPIRIIFNGENHFDGAIDLSPGEGNV